MIIIGLFNDWFIQWWFLKRSNTLLYHDMYWNYQLCIKCDNWDELYSTTLYTLERNLKFETNLDPSDCEFQWVALKRPSDWTPYCACHAMAKVAMATGHGSCCANKPASNYLVSIWS
jgi:hypothetical protein